MKLALIGDVMLGRGVNDAIDPARPADPWSDVLPVLEAADLRIANLECAITRHDRPWERTPKMFHFRGDPRVVRVLQAAHIDACSLANNHVLDFEERGLLDTIVHLDAAAIAHAGAGHNAAEAAAPAMLRTPGNESVGLVAFTDNEPAFSATADLPGTNYLPVSLEEAALVRVRGSIRAARAAGASFVVFSNHAGPNWGQRPVPLLRRFARAVIDAGADVYYGHSPHVFQGIELYRGRPILYSTGDFLDDYAHDPVERNDWSFVFGITMNRAGGVERIELTPVQLQYATVGLAQGEEREAQCARMVRLCAEMGTSLRSAQDGLVWVRTD